MPWEALTAISTALTGLVIGVTAIVGFAQIRQLREQRRDIAAVELVRTFQDAEFVRAFHLVMSVPEGLSADELRERGSECLAAVRTMASRFEMVAGLVYRRTVSFEVTEDVTGGAAIAAWHRIKSLVEAQRTEQNYPMYLEWFQWMAEQFEGRGYLAHAPPYIGEKDWKPDG